jgi:hypothetical protein
MSVQYPVRWITMHPGRGSRGRRDVQAEGVISSQGLYMIGEFCPKVFALKNHICVQVEGCVW